MGIAKAAEDPRRRRLLQALAAGVFALPGTGRAGGGTATRSIHRLEGPVTVNGMAATLATLIRPGDRVETGPGATVVFAVADDAFLLRSESRLETAGNAAVDVLRLATGRLLSVFARRSHRVETATATIGIRGTGLYVEAAPDLTYACTCYGTVELVSTTDPGHRETVTTTRHEAPRYIRADGVMEAAPMQNHSDEELVMLEALVGRTPPFLPGTGYDSPRRRRY